jgi:phospholipid-binding lipoprotein MlaA
MRDVRRIAALVLALAVVGPPAWAAEPSRPGDEFEALEVYDPLFDEDPGDAPVDLDADPLEPFNRGVFVFNDGLDRWVLDPITRGYQWLVPPPARRGVNRFFANLNSPVVFANHVLQLRPVPAAKTLGRFVAADDVMGLPPVQADFGQTLYRYGIPRGPYLMVPVFGPSTARDAVGTVIDQALDPLTYLIGPLNLQWQLILGGGQGLALRESNADAMDALRESSVDFYSALRSAYLQSRRAVELQARPLTAGDPSPATAEPGSGALGGGGELRDALVDGGDQRVEVLSLHDAGELGAP